MREDIALLEQLVKHEGKVLAAKPNGLLDKAIYDDEYLNSVATQVSNTLVNELAFFRNELRPFRDKITQLLESHPGMHLAPKNTGIFETVSLNIPSYLKDIEGIYKTNRSEPAPIEPLLPTSRLSFNLDYTEQDLSTILGSSLSVQESLEILANIGGLVKGSSKIEELSSDIGKYISQIVSYYKLATYFVANTDRVAKEYRAEIVAYMGSLKNAMEQLLVNYVLLWDSYNKNKQFIIRIDRENYKVYINGSLEKEYYEQGGTIGGLMGAVISENQVGLKFLPELLANGPKLEEEWERSYKLQLASVNSYKPVVRRKTLIFYFKEIVGPLLNETICEFIDDPDKIGETGINIGTLQNRLLEVLDTLTPNDYDDIKHLATIICTDVIFKDTNAKKFLSAMEHIANSNENLTPKDVATLACIDLIVDYLFTQVEVNLLPSSPVVQKVLDGN